MILLNAIGFQNKLNIKKKIDFLSTDEKIVKKN